MWEGGGDDSEGYGEVEEIEGVDGGFLVVVFIVVGLWGLNS